MNVREINVSLIETTIEKMCIDANYYLNKDIKDALVKSSLVEASPLGKSILNDILENAKLAEEKSVPMCQDTGMAVIFITIGQEVHFVGGNLTDAINNGVRMGYSKGYLRKSVVKDPLNRVNTNDNTPAIIHYDIAPGDKVKITLAPKGFGSENMSKTKMLVPSDGINGVEDFIVETVSLAGSNPCPPIIVGVGIGGTLEKAAILAKKALTLDIDKANPDEYYREMETRLLKKINNLGIGPQGLGGSTTALAVKILTYPTHIAGLPVAVNINCHAARHIEIEL